MIPHNEGNYNVVDQGEVNCCNLSLKTRYIISIALFIIGFCFSFSCFFFYSKSKTGITIFIVIGIVFGLVCTLFLAPPKKQWSVWKEKSGPAIAFVVYLILGISAIVVGYYINYWIIIMFILLLQWVVMFAYSMTIIEGGFPGFKSVFARSPAVYAENPDQ